MQIYKVLICDDDIQYIERFCAAIHKASSGNPDYRIDVVRKSTTLDAREAIIGGDYDIVVVDTCMSDHASSMTYYDTIRSRLNGDYHGALLVDYASRYAPHSKIFSISTMPVQFSQHQLNYARAEYFDKSTSVDRIAQRIINYFDTEKTRFMNNVFVVYGHNTTMRREVVHYMEELQISVKDLNESSRCGLSSVFDCLEESASKVDCAIVLLSGDDRAIVTDEDSGVDTIKYRARQNVIFEMGMFAGLLGRDKVIVLKSKKPPIESPSDIEGVFAVEYDSEGKWKEGIKSRLNRIGFCLK